MLLMRAIEDLEYGFDPYVIFYYLCLKVAIELCF